MTIPELTTHLNHMAARLETGKMTTADILEMSDLARKLYEQVIVLRHRAFEEGLANAKIVGASEEGRSGVEIDSKSSNESRDPPTSESDETSDPNPSTTMAEPMNKNESERAQKDTPVVTDTVDEPELRYEKTKPERTESNVEVPSNQISLIDSIEEIQRMEKSLNDRFTEDQPSLGTKFKKQPIHDLKTAIGINLKFRIISSLFDNNKEAFDRAIDNLNTCASLSEAHKYMRESLIPRFNWEDENAEVREADTSIAVQNSQRNMSPNALMNSV